MEAALEAEVSELRLTVASPTSVGTVGTVGRVVEAESEGDENTSPSRDLRSDSSYWGSRGQNRRAVRRADVSGVAPVREEGDYEKRFEVTQRLSPKPAMTRPARRGGRDAGAPVAQVSPGDISPIVEKPKWGGKYGDDGLRVSRYDFAFMVPKRSTASPSRAGAARTRELSTPPPRNSMLSPANEVAKSWERNLRSKGTTPTRAPAVQRMSPHHHDEKPTTSREDADASLNDASLNVVAEVEARVQEKLRQLETRLLRSVGKKQKPKKERTPKRERMRRKSDDSSDSSDAGPAMKVSTDAEDWTSAVKFTEPISAADRVTERSKLAERSKLVDPLEGPSGSGSNKDRPLRAVKNSIDEYLHRRRKRREEEREETRESERRALEAVGAVRSEDGGRVRAGVLARGCEASVEKCPRRVQDAGLGRNGLIDDGIRGWAPGFNRWAPSSCSVRFAVVNLRRVFGPVVADVIKEHFGRRRVPPSRVRGDGGCASPATRRVRAGGMVLYGSMGEGARGGAPTSSPEVGVRQGDAIAHDGRQGLSEGVRTIP